MWQESSSEDDEASLGGVRKTGRALASSFSGAGKREGISCPGCHDLLLGRGGETNSHPGNALFRDMIAHQKPRYRAASRPEKATLARQLVARWKNLDPPGRFLSKGVDGLWFEVSDEAARKRCTKSLGEKTKGSQRDNNMMPTLSTNMADSQQSSAHRFTPQDEWTSQTLQGGLSDSVVVACVSEQSSSRGSSNHNVSSSSRASSVTSNQGHTSELANISQPMSLPTSSSLSPTENNFRMDQLLDNDSNGITASMQEQYFAALRGFNVEQEAYTLNRLPLSSFLLQSIPTAQELTNSVFESNSDSSRRARQQ